MEDQIGGASELGVFVTSDDDSNLLANQAAIDFADDFTTSMTEKHKDQLAYGTSIVATVADLTEVPGAVHETPLAETVQAAWDIAPKDIQLSTMALDGAAMNLIFFTKAATLEQQKIVVDDMEVQEVPEGISATPSGLAVLGVGLLENLEANLVQLTWAAAGLVFLFLWVRLRSFTRAILSMVPVLIASGVATIAVYLFGIELSPMTAISGPLVVATCTEFTSLIVLRYIEERRKGLESREAIDVTASRTGRAFIVSAMTAIAGVGVIAFSSLPLLRSFGIFVALKIAIALLAALVVLPPLIVWADKRNWVSKGMIEHKDEPFIDVPRSEAEAKALEKAMAAKR
ncbi:MAG: MMPL family transporter [Microthrixaceae bacterium]|nr:MMPL family transporter [Microthrixaceae bacterium]